MLFLAGLMEVAWAVGLKTIVGFTRPWVLLGTGVAFVGSIILLGAVMRHIPMGTAYAVWTGVGAVGTAILGIVWFGEPATAGRLVSLLLIVCGIVGLRLSGNG